MQVIKKRISKATSTTRGKIFFFGVLFLIVAGVAGGYLFWQTNKKKIIRDGLESAVRKKSNGLYKIGYDSLSVDEVAGFLSVFNLRLTCDSLKFDSLSRQQMAPAAVLKITIPELTVYGVKTPRAIIDKQIEGRKLEIKNPHIEIAYTMSGKDSLRAIPDKEIYELILGELKQIRIDTVVISGATIRTSNLKTKRQDIGLSGVHIQLTDVRVDSTANEDTTRIFFSKKIYLYCDKLAWKSSNGLYEFGADSVSINSVDRSVRAGKFFVEPQLPEDAFVKSLPAQDDRFNFSINDIRIENIDFRELLNEDIIADSVFIQSASFKVYRDLNVRRDNKNRVGTYPHQVINKVPVSFAIKKITVQNSFIEYKEKNKITKNSGKLQLFHVNCTISNLTNKKELIALDNVMRADISSRFLNKAPFRVQWLFYLGDPNGRFKIQGDFGSIAASDLNVLTEPMGPARLEEGNIRGVHFNLTGDDHFLDGPVKLLYDNLKVALIEMDDGKLDKKDFASMAANIMIKNANPSGKNDARVVQVHYKRDANRSIYNAIWKAVFKGLKESVGIKNK